MDQQIIYAQATPAVRDRPARATGIAKELHRIVQQQLPMCHQEQILLSQAIAVPIQLHADPVALNHLLSKRSRKPAVRYAINEPRHQVHAGAALRGDATIGASRQVPHYFGVYAELAQIRTRQKRQLSLEVSRLQVLRGLIRIDIEAG